MGSTVFLHPVSVQFFLILACHLLQILRSFHVLIFNLFLLLNWNIFCLSPLLFPLFYFLVRRFFSVLYLLVHRLQLLSQHLHLPLQIIHVCLLLLVYNLRYHPLLLLQLLVFCFQQRNEFVVIVWLLHQQQLLLLELLFQFLHFVFQNHLPRCQWFHFSLK